MNKIIIALISFSMASSDSIKFKDAKTPLLFGEGVISTGNYETHPAFSPTEDTVYFLKCTSDLGICAICVSYNKDGNWTKPEVVPFSGHYLDADPFVTKDGNTIFFVSNRPVHEGDSAKGDWDIWRVEREGNKWSNAIHLDSPLNSNADEYYPTFADDGTLFFGSRRDGGKGGSDIYMSKLTNNTYTNPENLGDSINTSNNEYEPFVAPDKSYLIFMATMPQGIMNADFYISHNNNGIWSRAKKLDTPVNSPATDWSPKVTRDGKYLFFGSTRSKINGALPKQETTEQFEKTIEDAGNGLSDIYYINFLELKAR
jgi:Tol biopolymer transport system component